MDRYTKWFTKFKRALQQNDDQTLMELISDAHLVFAGVPVSEREFTFVGQQGLSQFVISLWKLFKLQPSLTNKHKQFLREQIQRWDEEKELLPFPILSVPKIPVSSTLSELPPISHASPSASPAPPSESAFSDSTGVVSLAGKETSIPYYRSDVGTGMLPEAQASGRSKTASDNCTSPSINQSSVGESTRPFVYPCDSCTKAGVLCVQRGPKRAGATACAGCTHKHIRCNASNVAQQPAVKSKENERELHKSIPTAKGAFLTVTSGQPAGPLNVEAQNNDDIFRKVLQSLGDLQFQQEELKDKIDSHFDYIKKQMRRRDKEDSNARIALEKKLETLINHVSCSTSRPTYSLAPSHFPLHLPPLHLPPHLPSLLPPQQDPLHLPSQQDPSHHPSQQDPSHHHLAVQPTHSETLPYAEGFQEFFSYPKYAADHADAVPSEPEQGMRLGAPLKRARPDS